MNVARERSDSRVPIPDSEGFFLERLGRQLRSYREDAGLTRNELAASAQLSPAAVGKIEWGVRRTRRSTLTRIAWALHGDVDPDALERFVDELCDLAGPALAAESEFKERVDKRRERRSRKAEREDDEVFRASLPLARSLAAAAVAEYRQTGKLPAWLESKK